MTDAVRRAYPPDMAREPEATRHGRRTLTWAACLTILAVVTGSCATESREAIRVGVLLPYSPDTADFFLAMQMATDEINAAGGVRGRRIELVLYDVMWDGEASRASFFEAVDDGAVAVIGGLSSALASREQEAAVATRTPLVGCCSTSDRLTTIEPPGPDRFFVRVAPPDRLQSDVIARRAYDRPDLACRALGILYVDDTYGVPLAASIETTFESLGGSVVGTASHPFFASDFSTQVAAISAGNPDCIVLVSNVDDGRGFRVRWEADALPQVHWLATDSMLGVAIGSTYADPHLSDGILTSAPWNLGSPTADAFSARFEARFGTKPVPSSVGSYDAAALVALALVAADSTDGDLIRDAIFEVANPGGDSIGVGELGLGHDAIESGNDVDYRGFSGLLDLDACGDVDGTYALLELDADVPEGFTVVESGLTAIGIPSPCPE